MKPKRRIAVIDSKGACHMMMIFGIALAMTLAMLIATAFSLHREAERDRLRERIRATDPYYYR